MNQEAKQGGQSKGEAREGPCLVLLALYTFCRPFTSTAFLAPGPCCARAVAPVRCCNSSFTCTSGPCSQSGELIQGVTGCHTVLTNHKASKEEHHAAMFNSLHARTHPQTRSIIPARERPNTAPCVRFKLLGAYTNHMVTGCATTYVQLACRHH